MSKKLWKNEFKIDNPFYRDIIWSGKWGREKDVQAITIRTVPQFKDIKVTNKEALQLASKQTKVIKLYCQWRKADEALNNLATKIVNKKLKKGKK